MGRLQAKHVVWTELNRCIYDVGQSSVGVLCGQS